MPWEGQFILGLGGPPLAQTAIAKVEGRLFDSGEVLPTVITTRGGPTCTRGSM